MKNAKGETFANFTLTNSEIIPTFTEPLCSNICTKITYKNEQGTAPGQPPTALKSKETSRTSKFIRCVGRMLDKRLYFNAAISFFFPFTANNNKYRSYYRESSQTHGFSDLNNGSTHTVRYPWFCKGTFLHKIIGKVERRE